ncbi:MAG: DNA/RNA non-specific endonuclease [Bacteroidaceae bacterium]|nr:DNA/RNA non-specific endonuclease [Bacteroidaceae bacterium]
MKKIIIPLLLLLALAIWGYTYKKDEMRDLGMGAIVDQTDKVVDNTSDYVDDVTDYLGDATKDLSKEAKRIHKDVVETVKEGVAEAETATKKTMAKVTNRKLELPARLKHTSERIVEHTGFTLSFNREHNNPNWAAWELTADEAKGTLPRANDFEPDPKLPENHQVTHTDYTRSGYDRGHMVPAADMKWNSKAMNDCFYMSNICPQTHALNAGGWETLESACRRWAKQEGSVYIVCGPVYKGTKHKIIGKDLKITVPEGFFKVVLSMREGKEKAIGFYYVNSNAKQTMEQTATTVDEIEKLTGMDFFVNIDDRLEERIESTFSLKQWK